jgi:shikimate kinase/3-dehydroquinate synthase
MGAGKTAIGREVARLTGRDFVDVDEEIERRHGPIARIFDERGEAEFRQLEERSVKEVLSSAEPRVVALGGGAVTSAAVRRELELRAFTVAVLVDVDEAWRRARGHDRPLARDEAVFRRLYEERQPLYVECSDSLAKDVDDVLLSSLAVEVERGAVPRKLDQNRHLPLIADEHVYGLHAAPLALRAHLVPAGEDAKTLTVVERLWAELGVSRQSTILALGGGSTTDVAGFVAATYMRGINWVALPTTLTGQVDAAIGGKTAINLADGKNLVGAFHFPVSVVADPDVLSTLPDVERRAGMAEVVKTGLLAGKPIWELAEEEMVRSAAAYKCAVVLSDPLETNGRREVLNLGHTFAHALEAASDYRLSHGDAVALGLLAALRLSGAPTDVVEQILEPAPVRVDPERAWAALARDKKARNGTPRLVLLEAPGRPVTGVELPEADVRAALDALIER